MASVMQLLPELDGEEMVYVQGLLKDWEEKPAQQFAACIARAGRIPSSFC